jgi:hypothetical protein
MATSSQRWEGRATIRRAYAAELELLRPRPVARSARAESGLDGEARLAEWSCRPLGRLGRRLVPEVERYLGFFALAHAPLPPPHSTRPAMPGS